MCDTNILNHKHTRRNVGIDVVNLPTVNTLTVVQIVALFEEAIVPNKTKVILGLLTADCMLIPMRFLAPGFLACAYHDRLNSSGSRDYGHGEKVWCCCSIRWRAGTRYYSQCDRHWLRCLCYQVFGRHPVTSIHVCMYLLNFSVNITLSNFQGSLTLTLTLTLTFP